MGPYGLCKYMLPLEGLTERPCLCVRVSATQGILIIWIFILFPHIQNCPAVFVRKHTGDIAPEENWDQSMFNFPLVSVTRKKGEKKM